MRACLRISSMVSSGVAATPGSSERTVTRVMPSVPALPPSLAATTRQSATWPSITKLLWPSRR